MRRVLSGGVSGQTCTCHGIGPRMSTEQQTVLCICPALQCSYYSNKLVSLLRSLIHCHAFPGLARLSILSSYAHGVRCQGADATLSSVSVCVRPCTAQEFWNVQTCRFSTVLSGLKIWRSGISDYHFDIFVSDQDFRYETFVFPSNRTSPHLSSKSYIPSPFRPLVLRPIARDFS